MVCACGCGEQLAPLRRPGRPTRTFRPGHHRRVQGILLAALAAEEPLNERLLTVYTEPPSRFTDSITPDTTDGSCLCGCGTATQAIYAPGHGYRFSDAMLRSLAHREHRFTVPIEQVVAIWRERQWRSPKATVRAIRHFSRFAS